MKDVASLYASLENLLQIFYENVQYNLATIIRRFPFPLANFQGVYATICKYRIPLVT
jgi:hypothetical protein